jgi:hypothetical protein
LEARVRGYASLDQRVASLERAAAASERFD